MLSVVYPRLVWIGLLAKYGNYRDYSKAVRTLIRITNEIHRLLSECADCYRPDIRTMMELKDTSGSDLIRDRRFGWLGTASFDQRLHWLRTAPIEHRVEWIFDRTLDPLGAPIDRVQLTQLLRDIEQQAHKAYHADTEHMRTTLSNIWLQLEYLIPLIQTDN